LENIVATATTEPAASEPPPDAARPVWRERRILLPVALAALAGLAVSLVAFLSVRQWEIQRQIYSFDEIADLQRAALQRAINSTLEILHSIRAFYASSREVEREEFRVFVTNALGRHPEIQSLEWLPRVTDAQRDALEQAVRKEGHDGFTITDIGADGRRVGAPRREQYFPSVYLEPFTENRAAFGLDHFAIPARQEAMLVACDTAEPRAIPWERLFRMGRQDPFPYAALVFIPIYPSDKPADTAEHRREHLLGHAVAVIHVSTLVDVALRGMHRRDVNVYLGDEPVFEQEPLMLRYGPATQPLVGAQAAAKLRELRERRLKPTPLPVAGRSWTLWSEPTPGYLAARRAWPEWAVLCGGLITTLLLAAYLASALGRTAHVERLVAERTAALEKTNRDLQREIAERYRAELRLRKATAQLTQSNKELEQFAYVASHDLQEPLRMISSYTQLLARRYRDKLDATANDFIGFAVEGVTRMQQLINDLLAYSRVGRQGRPFQATDTGQVLARVLATLRLALQESQAEITHDDMPTVMADALLLEQLFQNLIGNAIKFRNKQPPRIRIRASQDVKCWLFSVSDNGIGIAPEHKERIFQMFQRLHSREEYPGTGIGLAICKKIVEHHRGRLWVESAPGQGSTFCFTIPSRGDTTTASTPSGPAV
jgi:signal transduction histidine kinase